MSAEQRAAYESADEIKSDPVGLWDRDNRNHAKKQRLILDAVSAEAGDRVLEVGCGHGLHAPAYEERFDYVGVDISASLVAATRERLASGEAHQLDALDLPYEDQSFDAVVGTAILHHVPDIREALAEWRRVVRPGGSVTLMEPNYLFLKDFLTAHTVEEEQHKTQMAPWRVRKVLREVGGSDDSLVAPRIYTPPWPESASGWYDRIDSLAASVPGVRWLSQMLLIHLERHA